jgi:hypothetical protein
MLLLLLLWQCMPLPLQHTLVLLQVQQRMRLWLRFFIQSTHC